MKAKKRNILGWMILFSMLGTNLQSNATTYYSRKGTNKDWNVNSTWSTVGHTSATNTGTYPQAGDIVYIKASGGSEADIEIRNANAVCSQINILGSNDGNTLLELENGKSLTVNGNINIDANNASRYVHLHLDTEYGLAGSITINGDLNITHNNGTENIYVILESVGVLTVNGNVNINYGGGAASNDDIIIDNKNSGQLIVNGNINMTYTAGAGDINFSLRDNAIVDVSGNTTFTSNTQSKIVITLNHNNNIYYTGGNFVRAAAPNNYGKLNCLVSSTVVYDGNTAQVFAESGGAGTDVFTYQNVLINNTFGAIPQLQLENNEGGGATINKTITFRDGILRLGSQNLIIAGSGTIAEGSVNSWIDATITNGGVVRKNVTGVFNILFPLGDNNDYSPFTFDLNAVGGATYITLCVSDDKHVGITGIFNDYITRYWRVNSSGFNASSRFKVTYDFVDADIIGLETAMAMAKWNGVTWSTYDAVNSALNRLFTSSNILEPPVNHDFSGLSPVPLPIELTSFTGKYDKGVTTLEWKTLTEKNNKGYTVQISENASEYLDLEFVKGKGTTNEPQFYSYIDMSKKNANVYYYRLRVEENSGQTTHTKPISILCQTDIGNMEVSPLYPNPVSSGNSKVKIMLPADGTVKVAIFNMMGQKVKEQEHEMKSGETEVEIITDNLPQGNYAYTIEFELKAINGKFTRLSKPVEDSHEKVKNLEPDIDD